MSISEWRATGALALVLACRMLGLFIVLPVLSLAATDYPDATPLMVGLALGGYGLTQALFQIPLGWLSDRIGRRPVVVLGLAVFILGSLLAAVADSMAGVVCIRLLQGAGAISSTIMALVADVTRDESRSQAMAVVGGSIGLAFMAAMVAGPGIADALGVSAVFVVTAALAGLALLLFSFLVPQAGASSAGAESRIPVGAVLKDSELWRLNFGVFTLHFSMMASFLAVPLIFTQQLGVGAGMHWHYYLPILVLSFCTMLPALILGETRRKNKAVLIGGILVLVASQLAFAVDSSSWRGVVGALFFFFVAFNLLEALLPALVSRQAPASAKGAAMGLFATAQFLGAFCGAALGGAVLQHWSARYGNAPLFGLLAGLGICWVVVAAGMARPRYLVRYRVPVDAGADAQQVQALLAQLAATEGVDEVSVAPGEPGVFLKADPRRLAGDVIDRLSLSRA